MGGCPPGRALARWLRAAHVGSGARPERGSRFPSFFEHNTRVVATDSEAELGHPAGNVVGALGRDLARWLGLGLGLGLGF